MNEPLNNSHPGVSFSGKSYNKHPHWYNQPLRLTKEQKREPLPVLDDFFECYHLNEVRQTLWEWLSEILSSQRSVAIEPLDRINHIYFYEKIEGVIEAVFVIKNKIHKHRRKRKKKELKKKSQPGKVQVIKPEQSTCLQNLIPTEESVQNDEKFNKPKRLIEYAEEDPIYVIKEVFNPEKEFTSDQLNAWLQIGLTAECIAYDYSEQREQLKNFHDDLLMLTDSLFIIYSCNVENTNSKKQDRYTYKVSVLSQDQIASPEKTIKDFFEKYTTTYINRELEDWLEVAICYSGKRPNDLFCRGQLLDTHRSVQCLIKSAEILLTQKD